MHLPINVHQFVLNSSFILTSDPKGYIVDMNREESLGMPLMNSTNQTGHHNPQFCGGES
jgi:hypothetical protein